jgi:hypothetical protein
MARLGISRCDARHTYVLPAGTRGALPENSTWGQVPRRPKKFGKKRLGALEPMLDSRVCCIAGGCPLSAERRIDDGTGVAAYSCFASSFGAGGLSRTILRFHSWRRAKATRHSAKAPVAFLLMFNEIRLASPPPPALKPSRGPVAAPWRLPSRSVRPASS